MSYGKLHTEYPEPGDKLEGAVRVALKLLASVFHKKKAILYDAFIGDFDGELTKWVKRRKPLKEQRIFTDQLIQIFEGTASKIDLQAIATYHEIMKKIGSNSENVVLLNSLVGSLNEYRERLELAAVPSPELAARKDLSFAIGDLAGLADSSTQPARKAEAQFGDAMVELAPFPQCIRDIAALVRTATECVAIHTDAIDFGSFRDFAVHRALLDAMIDRARAGKTIEVLIWTDRQPMSFANRFRDPAARGSSQFKRCLREFLSALKKSTNLATTEEYKIVEGCLLNQADWVKPDGDIRKLLKLQMRLHELELAELKAEGIHPRGSNRDLDLTSINTKSDKGTLAPYYWIVDRDRGILVYPENGSDASASATGDKRFLRGLLTTFYSNYDQQE